MVACGLIHMWMSPYDYQMEVLFAPDEDKLRAQAQRVLDASIEGIDTTGVEIDTLLVEGDPRDELVRAGSSADLPVTSFSCLRRRPPAWTILPAATILTEARSQAPIGT